MLYDVKLAVRERGKVDTCLRSGGNLIERDDIIKKAHDILNGGADGWKRTGAGGREQ